MARRLVVAVAEREISAEPISSRELALALGDWLPQLLPAYRFETWTPDVDRPSERPREHRATCICVTPEALKTAELFHAAGAAFPAVANGIAVPVVLRRCFTSDVSARE